MKSKQAGLLVFTLFCLLGGTVFSLVSSQDVGPQTLAVTLYGPGDGSTITSYSLNFTYRPTITGNDTFVIAKLVINGSLTAAANQTAIINAASNQISYTFSSNGTYLWNVQVQNSTNTIVSAVDFTVKVAVPPEPTPTPAPTPTAAPTPTPTPTPAPTATPTPTPPASPSPKPTPAKFTVDVWTILVIGLVILAVILAAVIVFLRKEAR